MCRFKVVPFLIRMWYTFYLAYTLIDDVAMLDSDDDKLGMICRMSQQRYSAEDRTKKCNSPFDRLQMAWARALIENKIISAKSAESLSKRFNKFKQ